MAEAYAAKAARTAAAQLAEAAGFEAAQQSSLDTLADLLLRYIAEVGSASQGYAELAGRTESNPLDVVGARGAVVGAGSARLPGGQPSARRAAPRPAAPRPAARPPLIPAQVLARSDRGVKLEDLSEYARVQVRAGPGPQAAPPPACAVVPGKKAHRKRAHSRARCRSDVMARCAERQLATGRACRTRSHLPSR